MMINEYDMRDTYTDANELIGTIAGMTDASTPEGADEVMANLWYLVLLGQQVERATTEAVARLRDQGVTWALIATGLGVTKQAAQQRYRA